MAALARRGIIRSPRGPFAFPGGQPCVPGNSGFIFSAVPIGTNFASLLQGARAGTVSGSSIVAGSLPTIGPVVTLPSGATSSGARFTYTGNQSTNFSLWSCAAIVQYSAFTATQYIFANASNANGVGVHVTAAGVLTCSLYGVVARGSGITLLANVPYFILVSQNGTTAIEFLALRLDNGVLRTATTAGGTPNAGNGSYTIGNSSAIVDVMNGSIAAVAFSSNYTPPAMARMLATSPWKLWYPE